MSLLRLASTAKLNLFLEVLGRRPDGYHELSTLFQEIDFGDALTARVGPGLSFTCSDKRLAGSDNLVIRAARAYSAAVGRPLGMRLHLEKKVPMGAGIGGGSGDAAAALKLAWKWDTGQSWSRFPAARWAGAARALGADVPFFLKGGFAEGRGVGEKLTALPARRRLHFVLLFPRIFTSTPEVFKGLQFPLTKRVSGLRLKRAISDGAPPRVWAGWLFNRLEEVAFRRWPKIAEARRALESAGCLAARMTGSGSAVFGLVESPGRGRAVLSRLGKGDFDAWIVKSAGVVT